MKAIATYKRVSNKEQARDGEAYARQGWQLDREAAKYPDRDRLQFSDIQSGRRDDRPDFLKLIAAIEGNKIDTLIITRIDRIGRDVESNSRLQKQLQRKEVKVYEILLGRFLDFKNPNDWSYFVQAGLDGEKESRMLSTRILQTFEYKRAKLQMGGGRVGFPYRRNSDGNIEPDPDNWDLAIECVKIAIDRGGASMKAIAKIRELGLDRSRIWLSRWLRSPLLRGHTPIGAFDRIDGKRKLKQPEQFEIFRDTHPSLFADPQLMGAEKQVDRIVADAKRYKGKAIERRIHALSGLVWCGRCGKICHVKCTQSRIYLACSQRSNGKSCGSEYGKRQPINTPYPIVEAQVILALTNKAAELIDLEIARLPTEKPEHPDIIKLRGEIRRLENLNDPDLKEAIDSKTDRLNELLLADPVDAMTDRMRQEFIDTFSSGGDFWLCGSESEKRSIYRDWVREVTVDRDRIIVRLIV